MILEGVWLNLQFDLDSFVEGCFEGSQGFRSIEGISIQGPALVRRVFTCKTQLPDSFPYVIEREFGVEQAQGYEQYVNSRLKSNLVIQNLSQNYQFSTGVDHMNQVMSHPRMVYFGNIIEEAGLLHKNLTSSPGSKKLRPALAFGERVVHHKEI